jgi:hypothetical protein
MFSRKVIMEVRLLYWFLCGACATLLSPAWASKQLVSPNGNQNEKSFQVKANNRLSQGEPNRNPLIKRQPWSAPKSDPFSRIVTPPAVVAPVENIVAAPLPLSFPYIYVGKLLADEKHAVFLSRNDQIFSVVEGDTLESNYRIERINSDSLEVTYLPEQTIITVPFDSLIEKPTSPTKLSQADVPQSRGTPQPQTEARNKNAPSVVHNTPIKDEHSQTPYPIPPSQTEVLKIMGATPPSQEDTLKMMGSTPPSQEDVLKMMGATPPSPEEERQMRSVLSGSGRTDIPSSSTASAVPAIPQSATPVGAQ